jgi:hypothetical protein
MVHAEPERQPARPQFPDRGILDKSNVLLRDISALMSLFLYHGQASGAPSRNPRRAKTWREAYGRPKLLPFGKHVW